MSARKLMRTSGRCATREPELHRKHHLLHELYDAFVGSSQRLTRETLLRIGRARRAVGEGREVLHPGAQYVVVQPGSLSGQWTATTGCSSSWMVRIHNLVSAVPGTLSTALAEDAKGWVHKSDFQEFFIGSLPSDMPKFEETVSELSGRHWA